MSFLKDYEPVEERLAKFYADWPQGRVRTFRRDAPEGEYIFEAHVWRVPAGPMNVLQTARPLSRQEAERLAEQWQDAAERNVTPILDPSVTLAAVSQDPDATGWAHESVAQLPANMKASALEVCETSAIGRALANLGYAPRGKRPSREEMASKASPAPHAGTKAGTHAAGDTPSAAHQPGETTGKGVQGRESAADDGKGSAPGSGEVGADLKPTDDDDIVSLLQKAVVVMGSTAKVVRYVKDNIDKDIRSEADLVEAHLLALLDNKLGVTA